METVIHNNGHNSCILNHGEKPGKWYCPDCLEADSLACSICELSSPKESMIMCDLCGESYHHFCHSPQVKFSTRSPWRCSKCPSMVTDIVSILGTQSEDTSSPATSTSTSTPSSSLSSEGVETPARSPDVKEKEQYPGCSLYVSPERGSLCDTGENTPSVKTPEDVPSSGAAGNAFSSSSSGGSSRRSSVTTSDERDASVKEEPAPLTVEEEQENAEEDVILVSDAESEKDPLATPEIDPDKPKDPLEEYPVDMTIPDPSSWSAKQVAQYFAQHFDQPVATVFEEQDIDGQSLLLMQRSDVLKGLGFKLGVALRVLYHVKQLQIRRSDLHLLWTYQ